MSAHTPGPWVLNTSPNCWTVLQAGSSGRWHVAGGTGWGIPGKWAEAEANARLIAAAPDMLAVLLKLRRGDLHQRVRHLYDEAQAAIAKATWEAA